jgi:DNA-binding YbaB/EbfC family protein
MKFDMQGMIEQAQKVKQEMERVRNEVNKKTASGESGGGMVTAVVTGANQLISIKIAKEVVNTEDIEMLEDLIVAAVNKALNSAGEMVQKELGTVTGMLPNIPGFDLNM